MRHITLEDDGFTFDVVPEPSEHQLDETLHLSCIALLGACVVTNEMFGYTEAGQLLPALGDKLVALQNEKFGNRPLVTKEEPSEL